MQIVINFKTTVLAFVRLLYKPQRMTYYYYSLK